MPLWSPQLQAQQQHAAGSGHTARDLALRLHVSQARHDAPAAHRDKTRAPNAAQRVLMRPCHTTNKHKALGPPLHAAMRERANAATEGHAARPARLHAALSQATHALRPRIRRRSN